MKRATIKSTVEVFKNTKYKLEVLSFDPITKLRKSSYGGLNLIEAFNEVLLKINQGLLVLVFDKREVDIVKIEIQQGSRVHFDMVKNLAIKEL